ncbi:hypothetical protein Leryth_004193 [Lithospermum erythrorhizon]|nr:hypothetical protein Leryth_004193 [Lithospermum erythrorhizon]
MDGEIDHLIFEHTRKTSRKLPTLKTPTTLITLRDGAVPCWSCRSFKSLRDRKLIFKRLYQNLKRHWPLIRNMTLFGVTGIPTHQMLYDSDKMKQRFTLTKPPSIFDKHLSRIPVMIFTASLLMAAKVILP